MKLSAERTHTQNEMLLIQILYDFLSILLKMKQKAQKMLIV